MRCNYYRVKSEPLHSTRDSQQRTTEVRDGKSPDLQCSSQHHLRESLVPMDLVLHLQLHDLEKKIVWPSGYKFVHVLNEFLSILLLVGYGTMTCISKGPCDIKCSRRCFLAIWIIYFRGNVIWQTHVVNSLPTVTDVRTQKGRKSKLQVLKHFTLLPFHFIFLDRFLRSSGSLQTSKRVWRLLWTLIFWSTGIVGVYHKAFFSTVIF